MEKDLRAITWEGLEHSHKEKGSDWYLAFAIIVISVVAVAALFDNFLFALLLGVAGLTMALAISRKPSIIPYAVTVRGIRIDESLYPYSTLRSYYIDEDHHEGPQLLIMSSQKLMPILIMPIPEEYIDDIEDILSERLDEEFLEEPFFMILLERFGF